MSITTPKFKIGDVVELKSGGSVTMTVSKLIEALKMQSTDRGGFTGHVTCTWFDENKNVQSAKFHQDTLEKVPDGSILS